jgi:uncharacterized damage-inducible protein DinB
MVRLNAVLDSWKTIRADAVQALEEFPASEIDFRPTPELMSVRELARHILDAGNALTGMLIDGVDNMATPDFREKIKQYASPLPEDCTPAQLAEALRSSIDERIAKLASGSPEFYAHIITRFDGQQVTRLEMLQMVKEHELTHRAQLFLCLRLKGIVPPTTRRRLAKK